MNAPLAQFDGGPTAQLFGPRGACLFAEGGPVWVADTGQHRLLGWPSDSADEPLCLGQPDLNADAPNGGRPAAATTLRMPTAICPFGAGMAVADSWNHRVLIWRQLPQSASQLPDLVLGQVDFASVEANRGHPRPAADSLFWPSGVHCDGCRLFVADAGNRRVLLWGTLPERNGQAADLVLGQENPRCRDQGGGHDLGAAGMVWPHAVTLWQDRVVVADAGANRIAIWTAPLERSGQPCDLVLGQDDYGARLHNRGHAKPAAASLAMPYSVTAAGDWLIVADTANSRLLGWHADTLAGGASASWVHGQPDFHAAGDNRWRPVAADSLCWPYGVHALGEHVLIADTGNNRVHLWRLAALCGGSALDYRSETGRTDRTCV